MASLAELEAGYSLYRAKREESLGRRGDEV
jgi:hypothetical protein